MYAKLEIEPTWKIQKPKDQITITITYNTDIPTHKPNNSAVAVFLAYLSRPARCASRVSSSLAPAAIHPPFGIRVVQTSLDSGLGPLRGRVESQKADARGTFPTFRPANDRPTSVPWQRARGMLHTRYSTSVLLASV
ncbi:hypothetical protein TWF192_007382 [Orbilia oligospora]|uniref:Uncharacterized protein n=1 Tax=Orbilia oligospora TaxID=2813651 RepID=A0A6G1M546_ORBOL|nr:hypothetical protein TWF191_004146 [Orbilia oligospora]KAF3245516.1 hypothetical protein TWF192_007382 [Orbilia oligospora]